MHKAGSAELHLTLPSFTLQCRHTAGRQCFGCSFHAFQCCHSMLLKISMLPPGGIAVADVSASGLAVPFVYSPLFVVNHEDHCKCFESFNQPLRTLLVLSQVLVHRMMQQKTLSQPYNSTSHRTTRYTGQTSYRYLCRWDASSVVLLHTASQPAH